MKRKKVLAIALSLTLCVGSSLGGCGSSTGTTTNTTSSSSATGNSASSSSYNNTSGNAASEDASDTTSNTASGAAEFTITEDGSLTGMVMGVDVSTNRISIMVMNGMNFSGFNGQDFDPENNPYSQDGEAPSMPGGQMPNGQLPEGMTEIPEDMELPEGMTEMPEGAQIPGGGKMPGGQIPNGQLPEGVTEMPEDVELPEGAQLPEGMDPSQFGMTQQVYYLNDASVIIDPDGKTIKLSEIKGECYCTFTVDGETLLTLTISQYLDSSN